MTATAHSPAELAPADVGGTAATVERALDVLICFVRSDAPDLGVTELAEKLSLSKAAVHRLLTSLRGRGMVEIDETTHRYRLGPTVLTLSHSYLSRLDVTALAAPELPWLCRTTNETVTLSRRAGHTRYYLEQALPDRDVVRMVSVGVPYPLHIGASSKAFLAHLSPADAEAVLSGPLDGWDGGPAIDADALRAELAETRARGWAHSQSERDLGTEAVAAPLLDYRGEPRAVMSVCGPADRFRAESCAAALLEVTTRLSRKLGHGILPA
ncbi:IclR family transcriptional regulator [Dactylosporangium sp. CS-033363]|uniref:IclR family transcriptional regulator n=1 Tax=Dactylosporangium sp. CS-033363 TaxID=3239935 RepID=UPI003D93AF36